MHMLNKNSPEVRHSPEAAIMENLLSLLERECSKGFTHFQYRQGTFGRIEVRRGRTYRPEYWDSGRRGAWEPNIKTLGHIVIEWDENDALTTTSVNQSAVDRIPENVSTAAERFCTEQNKMVVPMDPLVAMMLQEQIGPTDVAEDVSAKVSKRIAHEVNKQRILLERLESLQEHHDS